MKYIVYLILAFISGMLFLPESGSTQIRNLPLLIAILILFLGVFIIRFIRYIRLLFKVKSSLKQKGFQCVRFRISSIGAILHGRSNMTFQNGKEELNVVFFIRKKRFQHYFFRNINHIEFYRSNRVVFNNIKAYGATVSKMVETKLVGKQKIKWNEHDLSPDRTNVLLFEKLPYKISDSARKEELCNGDPVCSSSVYLYDLNGFLDALERDCLCR